MPGWRSFRFSDPARGMDAAGGGMPAGKHRTNTGKHEIWEATMNASVLHDPHKVVDSYAGRVRVPGFGEIADTAER